MKKTNKSAKQLAEDCAFAKRTEAAYKRIEAGKGKRMSIEAFLEELRSLK